MVAFIVAIGVVVVTVVYGLAWVCIVLWLRVVMCVVAAAADGVVVDVVELWRLVQLMWVPMLVYGVAVVAVVDVCVLVLWLLAPIGLVVLRLPLILVLVSMMRLQLMLCML